MGRPVGREGYGCIGRIRINRKQGYRIVPRVRGNFGKFPNKSMWTDFIKTGSLVPELELCVVKGKREVFCMGSNGANKICNLHGNKMYNYGCCGQLLMVGGSFMIIFHSRIDVKQSHEARTVEI